MARGHVDADGTALRPNHLCREKHVKPATGAEIDDQLALELEVNSSAV
jgi:hypothetical protein